MTCMSEDDSPEDNSIFTGVEEATGEDSQGSLVTPADRPRGILSPTDREYLCGLKDYSHSQTELNRRQAIRERTIEGIRDFNLLWLLLEEPEWEKIIKAFESDELNTAFSSIIAFMYLGIGQDKDRMEEILERGLYRGANYDTSGRWAGEVNDVTTEIDIDYRPNIDELYNRVEEGEADQLTPAEVGALVRAGQVDPDDLDELENTGTEFPGVYVGSRTKTGNNTDEE